MKKSLVISLLSIYFFSFTVPQYINDIYYTYDRISIQTLVLSAYNLIVFLIISKKIKLKVNFEIIKKYHHLASYLFVIFFSIISLIVAPNLSEGILLISKLITFFISLLMINFLCSQGNINFIKLFFTLTIISVAVESFRINNLIIEDVITNGKLLERTLDYRGFTGNINISAFSLVYKLPVVFYLLYKSSNKYLIMLMIFLASSLMLTVLLLQTRGALLMMILVIITFLFISLYKKKKSFFIRSSLVVFSLSISIISFNILNDKNAYNNVIERFSTVTDPGEDESVSERITFYKIAFEDINENPLTGVGIGNWKLTSIQRGGKTLDDYRVPYHVHNDFLEVTAEIGIIGGLCYIYFLFFPFLFSFKNFLKQIDINYSFLIVVSFMVIIFDSMINFPMHRLVNVIYIFFVIALFYIALIKESNRQDEI